MHETVKLAHLSDIHCGDPHFMPDLMERAISEINELDADIVICSGDLTTFVLERDADGKVVEAFTPDFYLPEQDLFLEVTVMKQSLVTRKNRKLRKLRQLYPDVRIKLFYVRDFERMAARYGLRKAS